ncbi:hypothetical protein [Herbaspirillum autotrophicum]|uniref:hypothetical protein n=1 Tax=Herbaspirillum autotrophicum TaxID=180195 RepID=UPI0012EDF65D|nr:hypothetical protein [Herbaspirillum autotrophicum]
MTKLSSNRNFPGETFSLKFLLDKAVRIRAFRRRELRGAALSMAFLGGGDLMSFERIGRYEIDLDAFRTIDQKNWVPYLAIYRVTTGAFQNACVFPRQRVVTSSVFDTRERALEEGRSYAVRKIVGGKF